MTFYEFINLYLITNLIFCGEIVWLVKAGRETNRNVAIPPFIKLYDSDPYAVGKEDYKQYWKVF